MKKIFTRFLTVALLAAATTLSASAQTEEITVGTGESTKSTSPVNMYNWDRVGQSQVIYPADKLAHNVRSIGRGEWMQLAVVHAEILRRRAVLGEAACANIPHTLYRGCEHQSPARHLRVEGEVGVQLAVYAAVVGVV